MLKGKISQYTILARLSVNDWYIGAITNEEERLLDIPTDFLKPGNYRLEAIEDGINANARAEDYKKTEKNIKSGETLKLKLAAGGGWVARVVPSN